jgi:hypothetical protein
MRHRLFDQRSVRIEVEQEGSELLANPERAVFGAGDRLDVEVVAGEQAVLPDFRVYGDA